MRRLTIGALALVLAAAGWSTSGEARESGFSFGLQGAFTEFDAEGTKESGLGGGFAARYTIPIDSEGTFIRLQGSWSFAEQAEWDEQGSGVLEGEPVTARAQYEIEWSGDVLFLLGAGAGSVNFYGGIGGAFARNSVTLSGIAGSGDDAVRFSESSTATHLGWKVAAGIDLMWIAGVEHFIQLEYADYGSEDYSELDFRAGFKGMALRTGFLYRF